MGGRGGTGSSYGSLTHLFQLPIIDERNDYVHNHASDADPNEPSFSSSNILLKLCGFILFVIGAGIGLISDFMLLWSRWKSLALAKAAHSRA